MSEYTKTEKDTATYTKTDKSPASWFVKGWFTGWFAGEIYRKVEKILSMYSKVDK